MTVILPDGPYCYALADQSGRVFYVGKGTGRRMYAHERDARRGKPGIKCERIREILAGGGAIECRVLSEHDTDGEAFEAEKSWIAKFEALTNQTAGGGGGARGSKERELFRAFLDALALRKRVMPFGEWLNRRNPPDTSVYFQLTDEMDRVIEYCASRLRHHAGTRSWA